MTIENPAEETTTVEEAPAPESELVMTEGVGEQPAPEQTEGEPPEAPKTLLDSDEDEGEPSAQSDDKKEQDGAPESYSPFNLPHGLSLSAEQIEPVTKVAKELNLSQAKAQKLVDGLSDAHQAYVKSVLDTSRERWANEVREDAELGGEGFKRNMADAHRAYKTYASPGLKEFLNTSGLGNHPEVVRLFYRIGRETAQDKGVRGEASAPKQVHRRFPNSPMVVEE